MIHQSVVATPVTQDQHRVSIRLITESLGYNPILMMTDLVEQITHPTTPASVRYTSVYSLMMTLQHTLVWRSEDEDVQVLYECVQALLDEPTLIRSNLSDLKDVMQRVHDRYYPARPFAQIDEQYMAMGRDLITQLLDEAETIRLWDRSTTWVTQAVHLTRVESILNMYIPKDARRHHPVVRRIQYHMQSSASGPLDTGRFSDLAEACRAFAQLCRETE